LLRFSFLVSLLILYLFAILILIAILLNN